MGNSAKKIIGLLLMTASVFLLLGGLYIENIGQMHTLLIICGAVMLAAGIVLYRLTGDSES